MIKKRLIEVLAGEILPTGQEEYDLVAILR
jgi:hypothetical protein